MKKFVVLAMFCFFAVAGPISALAGSIGPIVVQGKISDAVTGLAIEGSLVMFAEETKGGGLHHLGDFYTGPDGFYSFNAVSGSKYKVIATYPELGVYVGNNTTKNCPDPGTYILDFDLQPFAQ